MRGTEVVRVLEMVGEMGRGCDPGKWSVRFPIFSVDWLASRKSRPRIASVVSPSVMMTVLSN